MGFKINPVVYVPHIVATLRKLADRLERGDAFTDLEMSEGSLHSMQGTLDTLVLRIALPQVDDPRDKSPQDWAAWANKYQRALNDPSTNDGDKADAYATLSALLNQARAVGVYLVQVIYDCGLEWVPVSERIYERVEYMIRTQGAIDADKRDKTLDASRRSRMEKVEDELDADYQTVVVLHNGRWVIEGRSRAKQGV